MSWFAGAGLDLDDAVGNFGHFELKQAFYQARMGTAHNNLGALSGLANLDDVGLEPTVGLGTLVGHLFGLGQQCLNPTEVEQRVARVGLLDHAGDDVALAPCILLVLHLALGLTDALGHHLTRGLSRDSSEVVRGDVDLGAKRHTVGVELLGHDSNVHRVGVDGDPRELMRIW